MYGYIYKTTNLLTGLIYVGQHIATEFEPNKYIGSGTAFSKALKEHKRENFICELLDTADNREELNQKEDYWINYFDAMNPSIGYNLKHGGHRGGGYRHTAEDRLKCGDSWRGKKRPPRTAEHTAKLVASFAGFKHSEESKHKISTTLTGITRSEETRAKMSTAKLGTKVSEETKQKLREAHKDTPGKPVRCVETGEIFPTIEAAAKAMQCKSTSGISKCLNNSSRNKTAAGYHWELA
jgi:group I intron endonuclease